MTKETEAEWAERVAAWRESGLSAPRFVAGKSFAASTLRYWASRLKGAPSQGPTIMFARVERTEQAATRPVTVLLVDARLEVFADTDEAALAKAIRAVRSQP
jgi:hypothetical protein